MSKAVDLRAAYPDRPGIIRRVMQGMAADLKAFSMVFGRTSGTYGWSYWLSGRTRYDFAGAVGDGTDNSAVANCLAWITGAFPQAPVIVQRENGAEWETIPGHPLARLIRRPNPYYSAAVLWSGVLTSYHTDGNAYLIKDRARAGMPAALWYVPHSQIEPISENARTFVDYYRYYADGQEFRLDPTDVIHFRNGLDPDNPRKGRAPLKAALREVFADDEAALMVGALMRNTGIPGILVSPSMADSPIPYDEAQVLKADMEQKMGGDNRGRTIVIGGPVKVDKLAFSPEEMNLRELRRLPEERVSGALRLPAIVAQLGAGLDRSTFANYAEARESAWEDNIIPTQQAIADDLSIQLLPDFDDSPNLQVAFDLSNIRALQPDLTALYDRVIKAVQASVMTVAEGRRELGMEAKPEHEFYLVPSGYEVRAQLEAPEPEPEPVEDVPPQLEPPTDEDFEALLSGGREREG